MLRQFIAVTATSFIGLASIAMTAQAAPFNVGDAAKAKDNTELVQVRGGRGGGGRGFGGGRSFGGGRGFAGNFKVHGGGGFRKHHGHHGHNKYHWKKRYIVIGGGYDAGPDCSYFYRRWQATGAYHWQAKYYTCIGG